MIFHSQSFRPFHKVKDVPLLIPDNGHNMCTFGTLHNLVIEISNMFENSFGSYVGAAPSCTKQAGRVGGDERFVSFKGGTL